MIGNTLDKKHRSKDTDQKDTVRVSNDSFHSSLDTRGPQKLNQKPEPGTDTQNINIEPPEVTMKGDLTSAGFNKNKSPVDREPIIKQDVLSIDAGVYNNSSPAKKGTNFNETLSTEPVLIKEQP